MMILKAGSVLKSTDALDNSLFENSSIFITEYNINGAVGFIINKPFVRKLNELEEFRHSPSFSLYDGGPVNKEHLYFIHQRPDLISNGISITNEIFMGGDFQQAIKCINNKSISIDDLKIFIGYCGWDAGELEAEIEEGSWELLMSANPFML